MFLFAGSDKPAERVEVTNEGLSADDPADRVWGLAVGAEAAGFDPGAAGVEGIDGAAGGGGESGRELVLRGFVFRFELRRVGGDELFVLFAQPRNVGRDDEGVMSRQVVVGIDEVVLFGEVEWAVGF